MKIAFYGLLAAGFVACSTAGIGPSLERAGGSWTSPAMIAGSVLGVSILGLTAAFAMGVRPSVLATDRAMVAALGVLIAAKVAVSVGQQVLAR